MFQASVSNRIDYLRRAIKTIDIIPSVYCFFINDLSDEWILRQTFRLWGLIAFIVLLSLLYEIILQLFLVQIY